MIISLERETMDDRSKQLVQESWMQVEPIADTAATLFYGRLFELDPSLRPLFPTGHERHAPRRWSFSRSGLNGHALRPAKAG
jgi:hypothetical protein